MLILGIDPGLATIGIGLISSDGPMHLEMRDYLTITTKAGTPLPERLAEIARDIDAYIEEQKPDLIVVEKIFFETNVQTAIDVAQARGVLVAMGAKRGIPVIEATPLQLKSAITGDGKADKQQMQTMIMRLLKLDAPPKPDDAADALALAIFGAVQPRM